ncbi:hypothetical protein V8G54_023786 [Vigna mungo]|uniref:Serine aminopeptidase S33 domain-containing protein n=1 Tax=Vigna mungo TaxID=3915 RepID=A0AAQ3N5W5_VIGMU
MGATICLLIHFLSPEPFNDIVLVAPMCKISDSVRPRWSIPQILTFLAKFFPSLPIIHAPDLLFKSIKVPRKKLISNMNPLRYRKKPRLGTVVELLRVTDFLNQGLFDVNFPFIVLHGSAEGITGECQTHSVMRIVSRRDRFASNRNPYSVPAMPPTIIFLFILCFIGYDFGVSGGWRDYPN